MTVTSSTDYDKGPSIIWDRGSVNNFVRACPGRNVTWIFNIDSILSFRRGGEFLEAMTQDIQSRGHSAIGYTSRTFKEAVPADTRLPGISPGTVFSRETVPQWLSHWIKNRPALCKGVVYFGEKRISKVKIRYLNDALSLIMAGMPPEAKVTQKFVAIESNPRESAVRSFSSIEGGILTKSNVTIIYCQHLTSRGLCFTLPLAHLPFPPPPTVTDSDVEALSEIKRRRVSHLDANTSKMFRELYLFSYITLGPDVAQAVAPEGAWPPPRGLR